MATVLALAAIVFAAPTRAADEVDLELVLLADAPRSIDDAEILFQRQGCADAITHPDVPRAISPFLP
ncbi:MAG: DUF1194 domain-containing protein, partial [Geminicoccaceae bacterium]